jgi:hypothetical protein
LKKEEEERLINNPIPIEEDFNGWMKSQKLIWRKIRQDRKDDPYQLKQKKKQGSI